jgi:hypothetical protein
VLGDVGDRAGAPAGDELAPQLALDDRGLAGLADVPFDELLGDGREGVLLLAQRRLPLALVLGDRINALRDLRETIRGPWREPAPR